MPGTPLLPRPHDAHDAPAHFQRAFPWAGSQLNLDGRDDAPGARSAPEAAPAAESSLGPLHAVSHHAPDAPVQLELDLADVGTYPQLDLWGRLDQAAGLSSWDTRAAKCHRTRRVFASDVPGYRTERGGWSWGALVRCGHWTCPACGVERARATSATLGACIERWLGAGMGFLCPDVWMLSLTLPHARTDHPGVTLDALFATWEAFTRSRGWRTFRKRWGIASVVRVLDVTFGGRNGAHPHFHVALFPSAAAVTGEEATWIRPLRGGMTDDERRVYLDALGDELRPLWVAAARETGVRRELGRESLELSGGERAAGYFVAWGLADEVGASTQKVKSHLRLLDAAATGHEAAGRAYVEWCAASAHRQWVSSGLGDLRRRCGVDDDAVDAYRQRMQAERDRAAAQRGEPVQLVRPLSVVIPALLFPRAMRLGWRALVEACNRADDEGRDPQVALVALLARWRAPPDG